MHISISSHPNIYNTRIDIGLSSLLGVSRNLIHHLISHQRIYLVSSWGADIPDTMNTQANKKYIKKSYIPKDNDIIYVDELTRYEDISMLADSPDIDIQVLYEQDDYMIIHKTRGVLSHPTSVWHISEPSVVGWLYHRYISQNITSLDHSTDTFIRSGLVHRLDRDTDGLMLIAKTDRAMAYFRNLRDARSQIDDISAKSEVVLHKYYKCSAYITPKGRKLLDELDISREALVSQQGYIYLIDAVVTPKTPHPIPKRGLTKILNYKHIGSDRLELDIEILTGRTHQIRYHLEYIGLPIVGDALYHRGLPTKYRDIQYDLTAYRLVFLDPDDRYIDISL